MMVNSLRAYLKEVIEDLTGLPVMFFRANDQKELPFIVIDFEDLSFKDFVTREFDLRVEFWAKDSPKEICDAADKVAESFRHYKDMADDFSIQIYTDRGVGFIDDTDKSIWHLSAGYQMNITPRSE